jgi:C1A family cysteine protease
MFSKVIVALALVGSASATFYTEDARIQKVMFENFKSEYNKQYSPEEEEHRFAVFVSNLKLIDARNAKEQGSATHGITKFADQSVEEFKKSHLNYVHVERADKKVDTSYSPLPEGTQALQDWTGIYTTPVKDQGYCGSCWAFSVTEQTESAFMLAGGAETILSPQQVTSCTKYLIPSVGGCNGGKPETGYQYAEGGLELDVDYPYTSGAAGVTGDCKSDSSKFVVKATSYTNLGTNEATIASYVQSTGPVSIVVDAEDWSSYTGGILSTCGTTLDHAVQAVGIDTAGGYWKVRNSWGTSWGESGYIRLAYGQNTCGITSDVNYAAATKY